MRNKAGIKINFSTGTSASKENSVIMRRLPCIRKMKIRRAFEIYFPLLAMRTSFQKNKKPFVEKGVIMNLYLIQTPFYKRYVFYVYKTK